MAEHSQFGSSKPAQSGNPQHCAQCEAMLMDALDGTLSAADQATFDLHLLSCAACSAMVADARRGSEWLEMLKTPRPEPSAALLDRIFAETCGAAALAENASSKISKVSKAKSSSPYLVPSNTLLGRPVPAVAIAPTSSNMLPFRSRVAASFNLRTLGQTLLQPRLAMTAAMAFFSVALTLNLTGVKLSELHASDLRPSSLKRSLSEANAHVVRYYDNLRVVYELESRVHDLQGSSESENPTPTTQSSPSDSDSKPSSGQPSNGQPQNQDQKKEARPQPRPGTSRRDDLRNVLPLRPRYVTVGSAGFAEVEMNQPQMNQPRLNQPYLSSLSPCMIPCTTQSTTHSPIEVQEWRLV